MFLLYFCSMSLNLLVEKSISPASNGTLNFPEFISKSPFTIGKAPHAFTSSLQVDFEDKYNSSKMIMFEGISSIEGGSI